MKRTITNKVRGFRTVDGAGVSLVRVLGGQTTETYDPILMLDSFDSYDPDDYRAGFPMHPHRGIETISYVVEGAMRHRDNLGHEATVGNGEVQWMCAGSGIMHEEMIPAAGRLLGVQLWLNLPAQDKMCPPTYRSIGVADIPEVELEGVKVRVFTGAYGAVRGHESEHLPLDYYDIVLEPGACIEVPTDAERSVMVFTLLGDAIIAGESVAEKTAAKLSAGDAIEIAAGKAADGESSQPTHVLLMSSQALHEPIAWGGPIVMNTREELEQAFDDLDRGTFLRDTLDYE